MKKVIYSSLIFILLISIAFSARVLTSQHVEEINPPIPCLEIQKTIDTQSDVLINNCDSEILINTYETGNTSSLIYLKIAPDASFNLRRMQICTVLICYISYENTNSTFILSEYSFVDKGTDPFLFLLVISILISFIIGIKMKKDKSKKKEIIAFVISGILFIYLFLFLILAG